MAHLAYYFSMYIQLYTYIYCYIYLNPSAKAPLDHTLSHGPTWPIWPVISLCTSNSILISIVKFMSKLVPRWLESASRWPHDRQDGFKANREREILLRGRSGVQVLSPDASYLVAELLSNTLYQKLSDICHI